MIRPEIFRESPAVQEWLDEGRVEGRVEGELKAKMQSLIKFLEFRFPGWQAPSSLQSISNPEILDQLFDMATTVQTASAMTRAIDRASKSLNV